MTNGSKNDPDDPGITCGVKQARQGRRSCRGFRLTRRASRASSGSGNADYAPAGGHAYGDREGRTTRGEEKGERKWGKRRAMRSQFGKRQGWKASLRRDPNSAPQACRSSSERAGESKRARNRERQRERERERERRPPTHPVHTLARTATMRWGRLLETAPEATMGKWFFFGQLPYRCHLFEVASVAD